MDGYQKRTEKKKVQIKQAAFKLFTNYGIEKVTLKDIAEEAHVSPVTIYKYFGNKDEILQQLTKDFLDQAYDFFNDLVKEEIPFKKKIDKLFDYSVKKKKIFNEQYFKQLYFSNSNFVKFADEYYLNRLKGLFVQLIHQGKEEHFIDKRLSEQSILFYFQTVMETFTKKETAMTIDEATRIDIVRLFFYGLAGPGRFEEDENKQE
ncbi:TetR/AcrR family transcriptional regulator [Bacillaceae bacterium Marseille-Q3522]|nr:TetR/AcrR family transcriptional regulator [Bacillaceae bacterium Marseille-Q3522]